MSTPPSESPEGPTDPPAPPEPPGETWSLIAMLAHHGEEPPADVSEAEAGALWAAASALWHPALLARAGRLPTFESIDAPSSPGPREIRVLAEGTGDRLPSGFQTQAHDIGAIVLEAGADRPAVVREALARLGDEPSEADVEDEGLARTARDFLALGAARWFLHELTVAMGHTEGLDLESLAREVLSGARAWRQGDHPSATNRLRAAFELLTQARERFYPVDAYLLDICLVDPSTPAGALADSLESQTPVTFLAPALAIENLERLDPDAVARVREAIAEGRADVVGGSYAEADEPLLPFESALWQFRRGSEVYRRHLDDRNVETVARRRFALYPQLPQLAKRFGIRFGVHLGFDAGRFPLRPESKRLWESPDGSTVEALTRAPLAADRASQGLHVPWRLALTMKDDHVATLPLVHWPGALAPWFRDLRRVATYSPVLARWVTLNDYFHLTDRPFETFRPQPDDYVTPYLAQAVARGDRRPISGRALHARHRARLDALAALDALARSISAPAPDPAPTPEPTDGLEALLETGRLDEAGPELQRREAAAAGALAQAIVGGGTGGRPGYLVLNPSGVARRAAVLLPDAALDLRPEGPLRAAQFTDEGVLAVVDLPAFGYAWVPREADVGLPPAPSGHVSVRDRLLRNEAMTVEIDPGTGGIRGLRLASEETARLGQQLVVAGLSGPDGAPIGSRMRCESFEVEYGGPALAQATTRGVVVDPRTDRRLASFRQRFRLWSGRPTLEVLVTLDDLDPDWLERAAQADPWAHYLACRWAWPDPNSMLRRTCWLAPEVTDADRPETPDALDVSTRRQRTALLFGGLAHHRRHGARMLDTLLVAGREAERTFALGVALDLENPFHAAADVLAPAPVVATEAGPPRTGPSGWLFQLDHKSVAVTRVEYVAATGDERGWGVVLHLLETAGRPARCRLRCVRNPTWARQTDFQGDLLVDLPLDDDSVLIDLTPHEMARVEVTLG